MAQCSRVVSGEAIRVLWEDMDDIEPLLKVIPALQVTASIRSGIPVRVYNVTRPLNAEDWTRFHFYSRHIRSLRYEFDGTNDRAISLLSQYSLGPLLSSLHELKWLVTRHHHSSGPPSVEFFMTQFLPLAGTALRSLSIHGYFGHSEEDRNFLVAFLHMSPQRCPKIECLQLDGLRSRMCSGLSFVGRFQQLKYLDLGHSLDPPTFDMPALLAMSKLPRLCQLKFLAVYGENLTPASLEPGFPSLTSLHICDGDLVGVKLLLGAISSASLTRCSIEMLGNGTAGEYLACLAAIATKASSLVDLNFSCTLQCDGWELREAGREICRILSGQSFLRLSRLAISHGQASSTSQIAPPYAVGLGLAWPSLTSLNLQGTLFTFSIPALSTFASNCPSLQTLTLPSLDVISNDVWTTPEIPILSHGLRILRVYYRDGIISDVAFAGILDRLFPNLQRVRSDQENRLCLRSCDEERS
ncbi:hypothetical protein JAAARDRAFT_549022 [Jaapia argillacea MUCL 33604]|uniref:F-box domain-containing protein n=1 Tax=Jaapia argillacea MUCL 33604 TaxID=933084 RepID=A0A067P7D4_9AGAM|nr:hypothetical protein JAAARDRAFT_549022 [Jaapia argillacea MUCL 33604]